MNEFFGDWINGALRKYIQYQSAMAWRLEFVLIKTEKSIKQIIHLLLRCVWE